jgi:hypothetical protein
MGNALALILISSWLADSLSQDGENPDSIPVAQTNREGYKPATAVVPGCPREWLESVTVLLAVLSCS